MPIKINFTVQQARKVLETVPPGTHYYHEALRVIREAQQLQRPSRDGEQ